MSSWFFPWIKFFLSMSYFSNSFSYPFLWLPSVSLSLINFKQEMLILGILQSLFDTFKCTLLNGSEAYQHLGQTFVSE